MTDKTYYVYVIRCVDNSLYTGITTDVNRRFSEHLKGKTIGAKYTRSRKPQSIEIVWSTDDRKNASKLEYSFKKLTKQKKEQVISSPVFFEKYLNTKIDISKYIKIQSATT